MRLETDQITKTFKGTVALKEVSISLEPGIWYLVGPNGSGKSTLLGIIMGLLDADFGKIFVDGKELVGNLDPFLKRVGYLPQFPRFYGNYTVVEFLRYLALLRKLEKDSAEEQIKSLLERLNLVEKKQAKIRTLSGGMKIRLGIAGAFLGDPELVILDEPSAGLDPLERVRFLRLLEEEKKERIILIATHMISEIEERGASCLFLKKGNLILNGSIEKLVEEGKMESMKEAYIRLYSEGAALKEEQRDAGEETKNI